MLLEDYSPIEIAAVGSKLFAAGFGLSATDIDPIELTPLLEFEEPTPPYPERLVRFGDRLLFVAWSPESGTELWRSDGTPDGTVLVRDILPGARSGLEADFFSFRRQHLLGPVVLEQPVPLGLFVADDGVHGEELWASDGSLAGTRLVRDIAPGAYPSSPRGFVRLGRFVYFVAERQGKGRELWRSDGTEAGTVLVVDLVKGPGSSLPDRLEVAGSTLYFSAWTPERGREAWRLRDDGSSEPQPVALPEIAPGPLSSSPQVFRAIGGAILTVANDNASGFELWRLREDDVVFADDFEGTTTDLWEMPGSAAAATPPSPRR